MDRYLCACLIAAGARGLEGAEPGDRQFGGAGCCAQHNHHRRSFAAQLTRRHLWPVAGMDLMLLAGAIIAVLGARKLADPSMQLNVKTLVEEGTRRA